MNTRFAVRTAGVLLVTGVVALTGVGTAGATPLDSAPSYVSSTIPATEITAPAPQQSGESFVDPAGRFALDPPSGWTVDASGASGTEVIFADPAASGASVNVVVVPSSADLSTTMTWERQSLQQELTDYQITFDESLTLSDGTPAHLLGGTFLDPSAGVTLGVLQLFTVHDGAEIVVTACAPLQVWEQHSEGFAATLASLTVTAQTEVA